MKTNAWYVFLGAVAAAIGLLNWPFVTAIVLVLVLIYFGKAELKVGAGHAMKFVRAFSGATCAAVITHVICNWFFGTNLAYLFNAGGVGVILTNPTALNDLVVSEVAALIMTGSAFYLWFTSPKPRRWLFRLAMVLSAIFLAYHTFDQYAPLPAHLKARQQIRTSLFRQSVAFVRESYMKQVGVSLDRQSMMRERLSDLPDQMMVRRDLPKDLIDGLCLYEKQTAGTVSKTTDKVSPGSLWFIVLEDEVVSPEGITYVKVISFVDDTKSGYLRIDWLEDSSRDSGRIAPSVDLAASATSASTEAVLVASTVPSVQSRSKEDQLTVDSLDWKDSEIVPRPGDVIEFGPFDNASDVERLLCRVGGEAITDLDPVELWDGRYCGRTTMAGGPNAINAPLRLKLEGGDELSVFIKKN